MPEYGTSQEQIKLMRQIQQQRQKQGANQRKSPTSRAIDEYMEEEYERQTQSKRGQWLQSKMMWPGMIATMGARTEGLKGKVAKSATSGMLSKVPKGGMTPDELSQMILNTGGGAYLATSGLANASSIKKRAAQKQYEGKLGAMGKAERGIGNLSAMNRIAAQFRVAQLIGGGGMGRSVQGGMGLYGSSMSGMLPMMGAQIGLSIWKSYRIKKMKAQRTPGGEKAAKMANPVFNALDEQANMLTQKQAMKPGESVIYQALKFIGTSVAVNPLIYEELAFIREEREKGKDALSDKYGEDVEGQNERDPITRLLDATTGALDKTLAKYDIGTQLFNFFTTGQLPRTMQRNLEDIWQKQGVSRDEVRREAKSRGITMDQHRLGMTTSRMLLDMAPNVQMQEVSLLSGIYDSNRYILLETQMIRRGGFGVSDSESREVEYSRSAMGKVWEVIRAGGTAITNIPGINAIANMITLPFRMPRMMLGGVEKVVDGFSKLLVGGRTADLLSSEEDLQKAAGIYKSPQEAANEYLSQGLPDVNEDIRMMGAVRAQLLTNIYQVAAKHLELATGATHTYDDKPFSKEVSKGAWSRTAGKYLSAKGLSEQEERDRQRMEISLEKSFRGSLSDIFGLLMDKGVLRKDSTIFSRLGRAAGWRQRLEQTSFLRTKAVETYAPEQLMQAAQFRQRGIRGRDTREAEFFDPKLERRLMAQQDIGQRGARFFKGRGMGGIGAAGGLGLGLLGLLTGGVGLLGAAGLGAVGAGLGGGALAGVRGKQERMAFEGLGSSAEQFLGVRTKSKEDLGTKAVAKIEKAIGKTLDDDWFSNPANQVIIASILQTPDAETLRGGQFVGGKLTGGGIGIAGAIAALSMPIDEFKKEPLPVAIYGMADDLAMELFGEALGTGTNGIILGQGVSSGRSGRRGPPDRHGNPTIIGGQPPGYRPTMEARLEEDKVAEKEKKKDILFRNFNDLAEQIAENTGQTAKHSKKTKTAMADGKGIFGKLMSGLAGALPMLIGGAGLGALSFATGGKVGTTGLAGLAGKSISKLMKGPGLRMGAKVMGRTALKSLIKKIPFLGFAAGAVFGLTRMAKGDWWGGLLELASGLVSMVPGVGTIASLGIDAYLLKKDLDTGKINSILRGDDIPAGQGTIDDKDAQKQSLEEELQQEQKRLERLKQQKAFHEKSAKFEADNPEVAAKLNKIGERGKFWKGVYKKTGNWFSNTIGNMGDARAQLAFQQKERDNAAAEGKVINNIAEINYSRRKVEDLTSQIEKARAEADKYEKEVSKYDKFASGGVSWKPSIVSEKWDAELNIPLTQPELNEFTRKINPRAVRRELRDTITQIQEKAEAKDSRDKSSASLLAMNKPSSQPIPISSGESLTATDSDKLPTNVDNKLDRFLGNLLTDCSFEFSNRYKRYVYDSNMGFSFS